MTEVKHELGTPPTAIIHICKSCGTSFQGNYCNNCGEKVLVASDRTFKSFFSNFLLAVTITDNKVLKTLWMVISRPGLLAKEYVEGRRVNYFRPLQLFFILNIIYFLFPLLQLFNTSLYTHMHLQPHRQLARYMVYSKIGNDRLALEGYTLMYNDKSTSLAKLLIIVFVFLACIPMAVIYRKRNRYFTDHMALAVELTAFNLAVNAIALSGLLMLTSKIFHLSHSGWEKYLDDTTLTVIFIITNLYFLLAAGRTFYNQRGAVLVVKVVLGMFGLFVALEAYRLILFLITFWAL
jgi:hypothetical protein